MKIMIAILLLFLKNIDIVPIIVPIAPIAIFRSPLTFMYCFCSFVVLFSLVLTYKAKKPIKTNPILPNNIIILSIPIVFLLQIFIYYYILSLFKQHITLFLNFLQQFLNYMLTLIILWTIIINVLRGVAQMGARVVWDHEVAGSIPVTPTKIG